MVQVERVVFLSFAEVIGLSFHCYLVDILLILKFNLSKFEVAAGQRFGLLLDCMLLTYELDSFPHLYASSVFTRFPTIDLHALLPSIMKVHRVHEINILHVLRSHDKHWRHNGTAPVWFVCYNLLNYTTNGVLKSVVDVQGSTNIASSDQSTPTGGDFVVFPYPRWRDSDIYTCGSRTPRCDQLVLVERDLFLSFADVVCLSFHCYVVYTLLILKFNLSKLKVGDLDCYTLIPSSFTSLKTRYLSSLLSLASDQPQTSLVPSDPSLIQSPPQSSLASPLVQSSVPLVQSSLPLQAKKGNKIK